jgi:hypothetical protein
MYMKFTTPRRTKRFIAAYEGPCNTYDPAACLTTIVEGDYCGFTNAEGINGPSCSECCDSAESDYSRRASLR